MKFLKSDFYFQNMKNFFLKQGKKEILENLFYNYLLNRGKKKKIQFNFFLNKLYYNSVFFIIFNTKKKRNQNVISSFSLLKKTQKYSLNFLGKNLRRSFISGKNFEFLFEKELNLLLKKRSLFSLNRKKDHKLLKKYIFYRRTYFKSYGF